MKGKVIYFVFGRQKQLGTHHSCAYIQINEYNIGS